MLNTFWIEEAVDNLKDAVDKMRECALKEHIKKSIFQIELVTRKSARTETEFYTEKFIADLDRFAGIKN